MDDNTAASSESEDDTLEQYGRRVDMVIAKFENIDEVLDNAAYTAVLMHFLHQTNKDINSLLFYAVVKKYQKVTQVKNSMHNFNHSNNEILTVFVHPNSLLLVPVFLENQGYLQEIVKNINEEDCVLNFYKALQLVIRTVITKQIDLFKESLRAGSPMAEAYALEKRLDEELDRRQELQLLEATHSIIRNTLVRQQKSRCLPKNRQETSRLQSITLDFYVSVVVRAFATQYEYFAWSKKYAHTSHNTEAVVSAKSFLSSIYSKQLKKFRIRGHLLIECNPPSVSDCCVCENLLWGSFPQGLVCRYCQKVVHMLCKDQLVNCWIDCKKLKKSDSKEVIKRDKPPVMTRRPSRGLEGIRNIFTGSRQDDVVPKPYMTINRRSICLEVLPSLLYESPRQQEQQSKSRLKSRELEVEYPGGLCQYPPTPKPLAESADSSGKKSLDDCIDFGEGYSDAERFRMISGIKHVKSMNVKNVSEKPETEVTRSNSARTPSPDKPSLFSRSKSQSRTEIENVPIRDSMLLPTIDFENDPEMKVSQAFEPELELNIFRNINSQDTGRYKRILVLLELHHKVRFIRMTLKRFKYLLVTPWLQLNAYMDLFNSMSLNCVDQLYSLIHDLVNIMDTCIGNCDYDARTATTIYEWFVADGEANLNKWSRLSLELFCTNVLHCVRAHWMEHKRGSPLLTPLLSQEANRLIVVEQLANMRPLLFSLPLIAVKIVKDLHQLPNLFAAEVPVWEQILLLLRQLPRVLDKRCMPVVHQINAGIIVGTISKLKMSLTPQISNNLEKYLCNFPRTVFQNGFVDFQNVKLSNLRETRQDDLKLMSNVYVREELDAAAIVYDSMLVLLQKDREPTNGKLVLKHFKSPSQGRLLPLFLFQDIHVTQQDIKDCTENQFELTILLIVQAILIQIRFKEEKTRNFWYTHINKRSHSTSGSKVSNSRSIPNNNNSSSSPGTPVFCPPSRGPAADLMDEPDDFDSSVASIPDNCMQRHNTVLQIQNLLDNAVENLKTANALMKDEIRDGLADLTDTTVPGSPVCLLRGLAESACDFSQMCSSVVRQSQAIDPSLLVQADIVQFNFRAIRELCDRVQTVADSFSQDPLHQGEGGCRSDDELGCRDPHKETYDSVEDYIGTVVQSTRIQIVDGSDTKVSDPCAPSVSSTATNRAGPDPDCHFIEHSRKL